MVRFAVGKLSANPPPREACASIFVRSNLRLWWIMKSAAPSVLYQTIEDLQKLAQRNGMDTAELMQLVEVDLELEEIRQFLEARLLKRIH